MRMSGNTFSVGFEEGSSIFRRSRNDMSLLYGFKRKRQDDGWLRRADNLTRRVKAQLPARAPVQLLTTRRFTG